MLNVEWNLTLSTTNNAYRRKVNHKKLLCYGSIVVLLVENRSDSKNGKLLCSQQTLLAHACKAH